MKILVFQTEADDARQSQSNRGHLPNCIHILGKERSKNLGINLKYSSDNRHYTRKTKTKAGNFFFNQSCNLGKDL